MKLKLNREYAQRHLFVAVLLAGMGCWFGYDGFVAYPATDAAELYRSIEKSEPREGLDLEAFKAQKIKTQYGFTVLALLVASVVGWNLRKSQKFTFEFDDEGFVFDGVRHTYAEIESVDRGQWQKKGIVTIAGKGFRIKLDAWHHVGVKEFEAKI